MEVKQVFLQKWKGLIFVTLLFLSVLVLISYLRVFGPISNTRIWPDSDNLMVVFTDAFTTPLTTNRGIHFLDLNTNKLLYWKSIDSNLREYYLQSWANQKEQFLITGISDSGYGLFLIDKNGEIVKKIESIELRSIVELEISPDGESIAFVIYEEFQEDEIYILNIEETTTQKLTKEISIYRGLDWSPDGQELIFQGYDRIKKVHEIVRVDKDGENSNVLVQKFNALYDPKWSPDGQMIAFTEWTEPNQHSLWIINADGSNLRQILPSKNNPYKVFGLEWSPDSRNIVFVSDKDGYCGLQIEYSPLCSRSFYLIEIDTGEITRLTNRWFLLTRLEWVN